MSHLISHRRPTTPLLPSRSSIRPIPVVIRAAIGLTAAGIVGTAAPLLVATAFLYVAWAATTDDLQVGFTHALLTLAGWGFIVAAGWCLVRWGASSGAGWRTASVSAVCALAVCPIFLLALPEPYYEGSIPPPLVIAYLVGLGIGLIWTAMEPSPPHPKAIAAALPLVILVLLVLLHSETI